MRVSVIPHSCRRVWRCGDLILLCLCLLGLVPVAYPQTDLLIHQLKDPDWRVRQDAALKLGDARHPDAFWPLMAALGDADSDVRYLAAYGVARFGAPAVEHLIAALKDPDANVRYSAASALGQIGDSRGVEPLITTLKDPNATVRGYAAEALGVVKDPRGVNPLITALKDTDSLVRRKAVEALGRIKDSRGVEPLIAALKDTDSKVQGNAAEALAEMKDPRATIALVDALKHEAHSGISGYDADRALRIIGAPAVGPLVLALKDPDWKVRKDVVYELGEIKDPSAVEPLIAAMKDKVWIVRCTAFEALEDIKAAPPEPLIMALKDTDAFVRLNAAELLGNLGPAAVGPLIAALKDADPHVRLGAAYALGASASPDPRSIEPLKAMLKDPDWRVRVIAVSGLGKAEQPQDSASAQSAAREPDLASIAEHYISFVQKGKPGSEDVLSLALRAYGDKKMAETYLNCGNRELGDAAYLWARRHGYAGIDIPSQIDARIRWGGKKRP